MILAIYGAASGGLELRRIAEEMQKNGTYCWEEIIYIDDYVDEIRGEKVYKLDELTSKYDVGKVVANISIGEPAIRERIYSRLKESNIQLVNLIHPTVYVDELASIGVGIAAFENCYFGPGSNVGDNTMFQHKVVVGHDAKIGNHSMIGSCCNIAGYSSLGDRVFTGFLSGVRDHTKVGSDVIIAPGAIVFHDVEDNVVIVGNPARVSKRNEEKKVYKNV